MGAEKAGAGTGEWGVSAVAAELAGDTVIAEGALGAGYTT